MFNVELGKPLFFLTSKEKGGVLVREHIEIEVKEVAKSKLPDCNNTDKVIPNSKECRLATG